MLCPHCAGAIPDGSAFCGVCGRRIGTVGRPRGGPGGSSGHGAARARNAPSDDASSPSLFEWVPGGRGRGRRIAAVLLLDAVLAGAGVAMGLSWWSDRRAAAAVGEPGDSSATGAPGAAGAAGAAGAPGAIVELPEPRVLGRRAASSAKTPAAGAPAIPGGAPETPPTAGPGAGGGAPVRSAGAPDGAAPAGAEGPGVGVAPSPAAGGPAGAADPAAPGGAAGGPGNAAPAAVDPPPSVGGAAAGGPVDPSAPPVAAGGGDAGAGAAGEEDPAAFAEGVREVVASHMGQIRRCYERAAKAGTRTAPVEGKLELQFTIQPAGAPADVRVVANTTSSEELGACVVALVESWRFPSPGVEAIEFVWPFLFHPPR